MVRKISAYKVKLRAWPWATFENLYLSVLFKRILGSQLSNSHRDDHHLSNDNLRSSIQSVPSTYRNLSSNLTGVTSIPKNFSETVSRSKFSPTVTETTSTPTSNENIAPTFSNYKFSRRREQSDLNNQKYEQKKMSLINIKNLFKTISICFSKACIWMVCACQ